MNCQNRFSPLQLCLIFSSLAMTVMTVGCNPSTAENKTIAQSPAPQAVKQTTRETPVEKSSQSEEEPGEAKPMAQANPPEPEAVETPAESSEILNGRYLVGHTGQGLEVEGDRYRYTDEEGKQPWRSIKELESVKSGVIYDGNAYWCLGTMKDRYAIGSCSQKGWKIHRTIEQSPQLLSIPELQKGMPYGEARSLTLQAGWEPRITTTDNPEDGTKFWRDRGYNEVNSCSGTGMGFCRFEFTGSGGKVFVVVTGGRDSTVQKWWQE